MLLWLNFKRPVITVPAAWFVSLPQDIFSFALVPRSVSYDASNLPWMGMFQAHTLGRFWLASPKHLMNPHHNRRHPTSFFVDPQEWYREYRYPTKTPHNALPAREHYCKTWDRTAAARRLWKYCGLSGRRRVSAGEVCKGPAPHVATKIHFGFLPVVSFDFSRSSYCFQ